jgi:hypothetical protein
MSITPVKKTLRLKRKKVTDQLIALKVSCSELKKREITDTLRKDRKRL